MFDNIGKTITIAKGQTLGREWKVGLYTDFFETKVWTRPSGRLSFSSTEPAVLEFIAALTKAVYLAESNEVHGEWSEAIQAAAID